MARLLEILCGAAERAAATGLQFARELSQVMRFHNPDKVFRALWNADREARTHADASPANCARSLDDPSGTHPHA